MSRALPPLNALRAFEVAGRHGSFTRAAQELSVSHSAISRHVRTLEHRLGVQLFRNLPKGVELTPEGQAYLAQVMPALDAIASATESLTEAPVGQITVNSEPLVAMKLLVPLLIAFGRAYPEIDVRLEASQNLADLERYEADFAFRFRRAGEPDLPADLLSDAPIYPYAAPDLVPAGGLSPREIVAMPRLRDRGEDIWAMWLAAAGLPVDGVVDTGWRLRAVLAYEMALHGGGIYLGSSECVAPDLAAGRLVRASPVGIRHGAFYLVYGRRGLRSKAARQFRQWILQQTAPFRGVPLVDGQPMG